MVTYNLQHDEAVLLKADDVQRGDGRLSPFTDELILTNLHLIWVSKGLLGKVKRVEYFPLALIKVFNDQVQARPGKTGGGYARLEVYFQNGEEFFGFQSGGRKEVGKWIDAISRLLTGHEAETVGDSGRALPGTAAVADTLRDTFSQVRGVFGGSGKATSAPPPPPRSSFRCGGCGAPLAGVSGTAVKCQYCDSESVLP